MIWLKYAFQIGSPLSVELTQKRTQELAEIEKFFLSWVLKQRLRHKSIYNCPSPPPSCKHQCTVRTKTSRQRFHINAESSKQKIQSIYTIGLAKNISQNNSHTKKKCTKL